MRPDTQIHWFSQSWGAAVKKLLLQSYQTSCSMIAAGCDRSFWSCYNFLLCCLASILTALMGYSNILNCMQDVDNNEEAVAMQSDASGPLVALAFKLEEGRFGQLTYMRIYNGTVRKGEFVTNISTGKRMKVRLTWMTLLSSHAMLITSFGILKFQFDLNNICLYKALTNASQIWCLHWNFLDRVLCE